jgi:hypothetical protein
MRNCRNCKVLRAWLSHLHSAAESAVHALDDGFSEAAVGCGGGAVGAGLGECQKRKRVGMVSGRRLVGRERDLACETSCEEGEGTGTDAREGGGGGVDGGGGQGVGGVEEEVRGAAEEGDAEMVVGGALGAVEEFDCGCGVVEGSGEGEGGAVGMERP